MADADERRWPAGGVEGFVDLVAGYWKLSTRATLGLWSGRYSYGHAVEDLDAWIKSSASYAVKVADDLWGPDAPPSTYDGTWTVPAHVSVTHRPLTFVVLGDGLTAIGDETLRIPPASVRFDPPRVTNLRQKEFKIIVTMDPAHREKTLIFRGLVGAVEVTGPVTDTVLANNRDSGPVR